MLNRTGLSKSTNILNNAELNQIPAAGDKSLELQFNPVIPATKQLAFNTMTDMPDGIDAPSKLEGIAMLNGGQ